MGRVWSFRHVAPLVLVFAAEAVAADTVIPLEETDLGHNGDTEVERCLRGDETCEDDGVDFTLDDVINLGIVDHEDVAETPVSDSEPPRTRTEPLPSVDLRIVFDYNSADIRGDQMSALHELAVLLQQEAFASAIFVFMGHTDAAGSEVYNLQLSRRRAEAVAGFVARVANIPDRRIKTVGFGYSQPADPVDPYSERNRRVQLLLVPGGG